MRKVQLGCPGRAVDGYVCNTSQWTKMPIAPARWRRCRRASPSCVVDPRHKVRRMARNISPSPNARTTFIRLHAHTIACPACPQARCTLHPATSLALVASHSASRRADVHRLPPSHARTTACLTDRRSPHAATRTRPVVEASSRRLSHPTLQRFHECRYTNMSTSLALAIATFLEHPIS
jgi:hypothetical protein